MALLAVLACDAGDAPVDAAPGRGDRGRRRVTSTSSRRTTAFLPAVLDLVPGETILLHVINGGLEVHEAVIGDGAVQDAWEVAEAATVGAPPGPTPLVSVPPEVSGLRVVVRSGRAGRRPLDGPDRRPGSMPGDDPARPRGLARRLPHPGPLGQGDVDPDPLGRRPGSVAGDPASPASDPRRNPPLVGPVVRSPSHEPRARRAPSTRGGPAWPT